MRVAIFGATGGIGRWILAIARENADHVKILVRDRRRLPADLGPVGVIVGDVRDETAVAQTAGGCDVVFSALGPDGLGPTTTLSHGMRNIIAGMRSTNAKRLLAVSSVGVEDDPNAPALARTVVFPFVLKNALADLRSMEAAIVESGLTYTIARPAWLSDGPRTGLYRANDRFMPPGGRTISRADVADFLYRVVIDERTLGKIAALAY